MCIDFLPDGRLLVVDSAQRRLLRLEPGGSLVTHADLSGVSAKPWNDIVVDDRGNAYVNTIGFDFPGGEFAPGLVVLATPAGNVRQVAGDVAFPNGMAITPEGGTLIVAESYANLWVPKTSSTSCDQAIFVNQATDISLFSDAVLAEVDWFG
jgi:sugar lactone lactonase YvrE